MSVNADLRMSCAFNTSLESPEHARIAEQLGYHTAWFYDSPALCADVWTQMCRAADRTERIRIGPGVIVPKLRHPMVTASAIATLVAAAGRERVVIGIGTGFTGAFAVGMRPAKWAQVVDYIRTVTGLLRGEQVEWEGAQLRMLQYPGFAPPRPIEVPFVVAAQGPKGQAVAREWCDGVLTAGEPAPGFDWSICFTFGTVLGEGEESGSERAIAAAGHAASLWLHWTVEYGGTEGVPGAWEWAAAYDDVPPNERHLALHDGHLFAVNERDRPFVTGELLAQTGLALSRAAMRDRIAQMTTAGMTEVVYQPAGPDIPRELEAFAEALRG